MTCGDGEGEQQREVERETTSSRIGDLYRRGRESVSRSDSTSSNRNDRYTGRTNRRHGRRNGGVGGASTNSVDYFTLPAMPDQPLWRTSYPNSINSSPLLPSGATPLLQPSPLPLPLPPPSPLPPPLLDYSRASTPPVPSLCSSTDPVKAPTPIHSPYPSPRPPRSPLRNVPVLLPVLPIPNDPPIPSHSAHSSAGRIRSFEHARSSSSGSVGRGSSPRPAPLSPLPEDGPNWLRRPASLHRPSIYRAPPIPVHAPVPSPLSHTPAARLLAHQRSASSGQPESLRAAAARQRALERAAAVVNELGPGTGPGSQTSPTLSVPESLIPGHGPLPPPRAHSPALKLLSPGRDRSPSHSSIEPERRSRPKHRRMVSFNDAVEISPAPSATSFSPSSSMRNRRYRMIEHRKMGSGSISKPYDSSSRQAGSHKRTTSLSKLFANLPRLYPPGTSHRPRTETPITMSSASSSPVRAIPEDSSQASRSPNRRYTHRSSSSRSSPTRSSPTRSSPTRSSHTRSAHSARSSLASSFFHSSPSRSSWGFRSSWASIPHPSTPGSHLSHQFREKETGWQGLASFFGFGRSRPSGEEALVTQEQHLTATSWASLPTWAPWTRASTTSVNSGASSASLSYDTLRTMSSHNPLYMMRNHSNPGPLPFQIDMSDLEFHQLSTICRERQKQDAPSKWSVIRFKILYWSAIVIFVYLAVVGMPLWNGIVYNLWIWGQTPQEGLYGISAFIAWGSTRTWLPKLFSMFEKEVDDVESRDASEVALVIPCYKSMEALKATLPAALRMYKPEQIFVLANGNSPTPLDQTEDVCQEFGVHHTWVPVGSKITAEYVGIHLARKYKYVMVIDDDVVLPPNIALPTNRFVDNVACIGYTLKSVGSNGSRGTFIQQAQDLEYKLSGLVKVFQSKYASANFPHGAIALWRRDILENLFHGHPGFHISEDWYLGHTARSAGYRIIMCSQVFIETETPPALLQGAASRGGYGEMTIYKQRFYRWNFFFLLRIYTNTMYLLFAWRLGSRELTIKLFALGEVYDALIFLLGPVIMPIMMLVSWRMTFLATATLEFLNIAAVVFFNAWHLRRKGKNEMIQWRALPFYVLMKFVMTPMNVASVYYALWQYSIFFSKQHLRVTQNVNAWGVIKQAWAKERDDEKKKAAAREKREMQEKKREESEKPGDLLS